MEKDIGRSEYHHRGASGQLDSHYFYCRDLKSQIREMLGWLKMTQMFSSLRSKFMEEFNLNQTQLSFNIESTHQCAIRSQCR